MPGAGARLWTRIHQIQPELTRALCLLFYFTFYRETEPPARGMTPVGWRAVRASIRRLIVYASLRNRVRRARETELEAASTGVKLRAGDGEVRDHLLVERIPLVRAHVP